MVADVEGARRWANWAFERRHPGWIGRLSNAALILGAAGVIVGSLYASEVISGTEAQAVTSMVIARICPDRKSVTILAWTSGSSKRTGFWSASVSDASGSQDRAVP